jgi:hypothetical protein
MTSNSANQAAVDWAALERTAALDHLPAADMRLRGEGGIEKTPHLIETARTATRHQAEPDPNYSSSPGLVADSVRRS